MVVKIITFSTALQSLVMLVHFKYVTVIFVIVEEKDKGKVVGENIL